MGIKGSSRIFDYCGPELSVDNPSEGSTKSGSFSVDGWSFDNESVARVEVYVDGVLAGTASYGSDRSDVASVWPNAPTPIGFSLTLSTANFSAGARVITVKTIDVNGNASWSPDIHVTFT